jgi:hypothetical protein
MSLIKFNNTEQVINATLSVDSSGRVNIVFYDNNDIPDESILLSGFVELNEHNRIEQSDFTDMNYIYMSPKDDNLTYVLTNDEDDIYIEPDEKPDIDYGQGDGDDFPPYTPTLEEVQSSKITNLSHTCNKQIVNGVELLLNEGREHFSYAEEDQTNIKELFDLALQTNLPLYYHSDGKSCRLYTVDEIVQLYTSAAMNKMHHITYFNQLKMYIKSLEDIESVETIEYGHELIGEYLTTYNDAMAQARLGMERLLKGSEII